MPSIVTHSSCKITKEKMDKEISAQLDPQEVAKALEAALAKIATVTGATPSAEAQDLKELPGGDTTAIKLREALRDRPKTKINDLPGFDSSSKSSRSKTDIDCDEVYPRICLGNALTAQNKEFLKKKKVTHVLNAADGYVKTGKIFYHDTPFEYCGCRMHDVPTENISQYFYPAAEFIEKAVSQEGRVFVHCRAGVSRSATLVIAYLMIKKNKLAYDAIRSVKLIRDIINPNDGFLRQLAELDNALRRQRL